MMKRILAVGVFAIFAALMAPKPAAAHVDFSIGIGVPGFYGTIGPYAPAYVPAPVVYYPRPYYYAPAYPGYYGYDRHRPYYYPRVRTLRHHRWHGYRY